MARRHELVYALNAGGVDVEALSRVDLEKLRLAGEHPVTNWLPRTLGPMGVRPGLGSLHALPAQTRQVPFVPDDGDSPYILLLSGLEMRIVHADAIVQVPAVATLIDQGAWVQAAGSVSVGSGVVTMLGGVSSSAKARQTVTVASGDQALSNILRIIVFRGPVTFRVGTTLGGEELLADTSLAAGTHKISIVPGAGTIYLEYRSEGDVVRTFSAQFESSLIGGGTGDLVLPTPWASSDLPLLRTHRVGDVMFAGDGRQQPRRIEHRGVRSWSVAFYQPRVGPWMVPLARNIAIAPSAQRGTVTLTASEPFWKPGHVRALVEITHAGKVISQTLNGASQSTDHVTVSGVGAGRRFFRTATQTGFTGTLTLERSYDPGDPVTWTVVSTYVDGAADFARTAVDDAQDNLRVHYRFTIRAGQYTAGSVAVTLEYESGVQVGIARVVTYTSALAVTVEVLKTFGNTTAVTDWRIGAWSDVAGWPRVPVEHDGRLRWFKDGYDTGSVPDDFSNFDDTTIGESAPFTRSVGAARRVVWAVSAERLIVGTKDFEATIQPDNDDGGVTATSYTVRTPSRRGAADIEPAQHDDGLFFVQRSGRRLYDLAVGEQGRYRSQDVMRLNPGACKAGVVRLAVQQQPDTRLYAVLADGTVAVVTWDRIDRVVAINVVSTPDGLIEDVCVLPRTAQDDVYFVVLRNGVRYHEKMAPEAAQQSTATCALLDAHKVLTGTVSAISGGTHLAGQTVQVWADGRRRADVALDGAGAAALGATYARVVYGRSYTATFKSVKLAYAAGAGSAIGQTKIVRGAGVVLSRSTLDGLRIGRDAANLGPLPDYIEGVVRTAGQFFEHVDVPIFALYSEWSPDERVMVEATSADGPKTVQSIVLDIETRDGSEQERRG